MIEAKNSTDRITAANQILLLAEALGVTARDRPKGIVIGAWKETLSLLGVEVKDFETLKEALDTKFHDSPEVDLFVKALYVASSLITEAATFVYQRGEIR
jgi:hypothetical protein